MARSGTSTLLFLSEIQNLSTSTIKNNFGPVQLLKEYPRHIFQQITSQTVAFLSPEPVTMYLSSTEMSQLSTDEDSLDQKKNRNIFHH